MNIRIEIEEDITLLERIIENVCGEENLDITIHNDVGNQIEIALGGDVLLPIGESAEVMITLVGRS